MLKFVKGFLLVVLTLVVIAVLIAVVGTQMSLDRDYQHTAATAALDTLTEDSGSGIATMQIGDMTFRTRFAGFDGQDKPLLILLHGFPVTSAMWSELMEPAAQAGFRVVAFDQRGYSPGARPEGVDAYAVDELTADVVAVADHLDAKRFHLVGHDWGAAVGWSVVLSHPERVMTWTGLSIAHPASFVEALRNDPDQQDRSGYFALFQTPWVPETLFLFNDMRTLKNAVYSTMSAEQAAEYERVFAEPGALTSALNWYRAMGDGPRAGDAEPEVDVPTLFIWGNQDPAVGRVAIDAMSEYMRGPYRRIELDAGHWLMEDEPERVVAEMLAHLHEFRDG